MYRLAGVLNCLCAHEGLILVLISIATQEISSEHKKQFIKTMHT